MHPQGNEQKKEHNDTIPMAQPKQQRFALHTKNWMPKFSVILKEAVATQQGIGIQNHQPRKQVQNLSETQSKYEWCNANNGDMFVGLMRPRGDALRHPAAKDLLEYATKGCPVDCGRPWTKEELQAAIDKGNSKTMDNIDAIRCCREEALQKVKEGHCTLISWNSIKDEPNKNLKISPIAAIQHKSRKFRMILNLAYKLKVKQATLQSVNESTNK